MSLRDRVKELRRVPASELLENPKNWRRHPGIQREALEGVLAEIGFTDALIARETPAGLELIDGHLRREIVGGKARQRYGDNVNLVVGLAKYKYIKPLDSILRERVASMALPYPKRPKDSSEPSGLRPEKGGAAPTRALHNMFPMQELLSLGQVSKNG